MIFQQAVHLVISGAGIVIVMMFVLWVIHLLIRNAAIVDVGWALGLALLAIYYAFAGPGYAARKFAMAAMVGFWGFRLAGHRASGRRPLRSVAQGVETSPQPPFSFLF